MTDLMRYAQFQQFRDDVLAAQPEGLIRLDDTNPFAAMEFLKTRFNAAAVDHAHVLDVWAASMDVSAAREQVLATSGVRDTLKSLFDMHKANNRELWLPQDVYPFYWDEALKRGLTPKTFQTLPAPAIHQLDSAGNQATALITNPVSPLGRYLDKAEVAAFTDWLQAAPERRLVLDTVYAYQAGFDAGTKALFATGQCIVSHSLSKAWLERGVFGMVLAPEQDMAALRAGFTEPAPAAFGAAFAALTAQPDLPACQQSAFRRQWNKLTPHIRSFAPDFEPPANGYFGVIAGNHLDILRQQHTLVLPASMFGSDRSDLSVVSCLHNVAL